MLVCLYVTAVSSVLICAQCNNLNRRQLLLKLETEKPQYGGNNSEQYGNSESSLVEEISGTELNYAQPNTVTDTSTKL